MLSTGTLELVERNSRPIQYSNHCLVDSSRNESKGRWCPQHWGQVNRRRLDTGRLLWNESDIFEKTSGTYANPELHTVGRYEEQCRGTPYNP